MSSWGLGIEHEMRLRFSNKIDISNMYDENIKSIYKKFGYIPDYLFINSSFLLNMYNKYVTLLLKDYKNNIINETNETNETNELNQSNLYNYLNKLITEKKEFPFDDIRFYDVNKEQTKNFLNYYFHNYKKKNFKFLDFSFFFYNQDNNEFDYVNLYKICKSWNIINTMDLDNIKLHFKKLIDGDYEKEYIKLLKKKLKILNFNIIEIDNIYIYIKINVNDKKLPIIDFKLLEKTLFNIEHKEQNLFISKFKNNNDILSLLKKLSDNEIPHIDYSSKTEAIEFKTFDYKNKNYKNMLDDLIKIENTFFNIVNEIPEFTNLIKKYGKITYHHTGSLNKTIVLNNLNSLNSLNNFSEISKDYAGSFHVWTTIPYYSKDSPEIFINKHINLANRLQLLEPIFASYFTSPDIESIGNNLSHSRSSLRQFLNNFAGYGTSDISLLNGIDKNNIYEYYLSKEDVLNGQKINVYLEKEIYNNNNIIKNYDGLMNRSATSKNFKFLNYGSNKNFNNFHINDYIMQVFKNTKIRPLRDSYNKTFLPLGADIRTTSMNKLFYPPIESNYQKIYILEDNIFNLYYFDKSKNIITKKPKYNMKPYNKFMKDERVGIEFRIFDHFPTHNMIQFLAILAQIVSYTTLHYNILTKRELFINQQYWHDEMASSMIKGFEYKLDNKYIKIIEKEFSVNISKNEKNQINGEDFFNKFYEVMNKKLDKVKIYHKLKIDNKYFKFENFNKKVWTYNFLLYLKNKDIMNNLQTILKSNNNIVIKKENLLKLFGNNFKYDIEKIYEIMI